MHRILCVIQTVFRKSPFVQSSPIYLHSSQSSQPYKCNHIILVTAANFPFDGASANVLRLLTTGLFKTGREVSVIIQKGKFGRKNKVNKRKSSIGGVAYTYCGFLNRPSNPVKKMIDTLAGICIPTIILIKRYIKDKVDCVIVYNDDASGCILLLIICKILRIPIVNHVVEWYDKRHIVTARGFLKWWDYLFRMKVLDKYFDGLFVTSNLLKDYYMKKNIKSESILILPNLTDISTFDRKNFSDHKEKGKIIRIGYCGIPVQHDGINDLLAAFQIVCNKYENSELYVIGDVLDGNSVLPKIKQISKDLGVYEKVHFTGRVEWVEVPVLLNSCDILVLARPSGIRAEAGFPTKLGEYMASGKPVVVTKVGDIPLYLKDGQNAMLAEPSDPRSIADKICFLIENPKLAEKIGENGYLWCKGKLDYVESTKNIGKFLDGLLNKEL